MNAPGKISVDAEKTRLEAWLRHVRGTDQDLFPLSDWRSDVENGDTRLGADDWWESQLEQQLDESEFAPIFERIRDMPAQADVSSSEEALKAFGHDITFVSTLLERQIVLFNPDELLGEGYGERLESLREAINDLSGTHGLPAELRAVAEQLEADVAAAYVGPEPWAAGAGPEPG